LFVGGARSDRSLAVATPGKLREREGGRVGPPPTTTHLSVGASIVGLDDDADAPIMASQPRPLSRQLSTDDRLRKVKEITAFLAQLEGKNPDDANLYKLAERFEAQVFTDAQTVADYVDRIQKKLGKVKMVREQHQEKSDPQQQQQQQRNLQQAQAAQQLQAQQQRLQAQQQRQLAQLQQQQKLAQQKLQQQQLAQLQQQQVQASLPQSAYAQQAMQPSFQQQLGIAPVGMGMPEALDAGAKQRVARAEALRQQYENDVRYFVKQGTGLLQKFHNSRKQGGQVHNNSDQVKKLMQYVSEGSNALQYMAKCHNSGHIPSPQSLESLEITLQKVFKASTVRRSESACAPPLNGPSLPTSSHLPFRSLGAPQALQQMIRMHNNTGMDPMGGAVSRPMPAQAQSQVQARARSVEALRHQQQQQYPGNNDLRLQQQRQQQQQQLLLQQQQQQRLYAARAISAPGSVAIQPTSNSMDPFDGVDMNFLNLDDCDLEPIPLPEDEFGDGSQTLQLDLVPVQPAIVPSSSSFAGTSRLSSAPMAHQAPLDLNTSPNMYSAVASSAFDTYSGSNLAAPVVNNPPAAVAAPAQQQKQAQSRKRPMSAAATRKAAEKKAKAAALQAQTQQQKKQQQQQKRQQQAQQQKKQSPASSAASPPVATVSGISTPLASPAVLQPSSSSADALLHPGAYPVVEPLVCSVGSPQETLGGLVGGLLHAGTFFIEPEAPPAPQYMGHDLVEEIRKRLGDYFDLEGVMGTGQDGSPYLSRLRATCHGLFHVLINFSYHGKDVQRSIRPIDVSVLGIGELKVTNQPSTEGGPSEESASARLAEEFRGGPAWPASQNDLYQKVSAHAFQVLYSVWDQSGHDVAVAVVKFLNWMLTYKTIFSDPCSVANKQVTIDMASAEPMPPTGRSESGVAFFPENAGENAAAVRSK
jgi:hypothetical protein